MITVKKATGKAQCGLCKNRIEIGKISVGFRLGSGRFTKAEQVHLDCILMESLKVKTEGGK